MSKLPNHCRRTNAIAEPPHDARAIPSRCCCAFEAGTDKQIHWCDYHANKDRELAMQVLVEARGMEWILRNRTPEGRDE
jgi:hypothetical protein